MTSESAAGQGAAQRERKIKRDHVVGLVIVGVAFVFSVTLSRDSHNRSQPVFSQEPSAPTAEGVPGFPTQVDVVLALEKARTLTPRPHLARIHALGVSPQGTVDVTQAGARVRYSFKSDKGQGPEPKRPPGTLARRHYCGEQAVDITSAGIAARRDRADVDCEPEVRTLPAPSCGPRELWVIAKARGALDSQRANVEYVPGANGARWKFRIEGTDVDFTTGPDCKPLVND